MNREFLGFELIAGTQDNLQHFLTSFETVWWMIPEEERNVISAKLKRVVWSNDPAAVDDQPPGLTIGITRDSGEEVAFLSSRMTSDRGALNVIAHELRHVWQFATNFETHPYILKYAQHAAWESDARIYAENLVGAESNAPSLVFHDLPADEEFDYLVDTWQYLDASQRMQVLAFSEELAMPVIEELKELRQREEKTRLES